MLQNFRDQMGQMPWVLRIATAASLLVGCICFITPLIPGSTFDVCGKEMSWDQMWDTKVALALLFVGPLMIAVGLGLPRRSSWVRLVLIILPVLQFLPFEFVHILFGAPDPATEPIALLFEFAVWALLTSIYLFQNRDAKNYLEGMNS